MVQAQIPAEVIFAPDWWYRHYGFSFEQPFYLDRDMRTECDLYMRRALHDRFGLGEPDPKPQPVIGSMHVAGGFVLPALFGIEIRFAADRAPWPVPAGLSSEQVLALRVPDLETTWPMDQLLKQIATLEREWGYVVGDVDTDGLLNTALHLRGEQLFVDFHDDPDLVYHLFAVLAETCVQVASLFRAHSGSCAVATNRSILHVDKALYLHSNCSVQMISPATYERFLLPYEQYLAQRLQPYGIHHCGDNLHRFAQAYSTVPATFFDVGWGSDVALCRRAFPKAFLNLRMSPVHMLQASEQEIRDEAQTLIETSGAPDGVGLCCINMDAGTPDQNVFALLETCRDFRLLRG